MEITLTHKYGYSGPWLQWADTICVILRYR